MSETETNADPVVQEATALASELQQKAAAEGYNDPNEYLRANQGSEEIKQLEQRAQDLQQKYVQQKQQRLFNEAPELQDPAEQKNFTGWLKQRGYNDADIRSMNDERVIRDLHKSYRASSGKKAPKFKKGGRTPREVHDDMKKGNPARGQTRHSDDVIEAQARDGSMDAAFELMQRRRAR